MGKKPTGQPNGRPTKCTPEVIDKICMAIRSGALIETAATYAGVHKSNFYIWLKKGNAQTKGIFRQLVDRVEQALADDEVVRLARITRAASEQWVADAWMLERRYPDRYGRRSRVDVSADVGAKPADEDYSKLNGEDLRELDRLRRKARGQAD